MNFPDGIILGGKFYEARDSHTPPIICTKLNEPGEIVIVRRTAYSDGHGNAYITSYHFRYSPGLTDKLKGE